MRGTVWGDLPSPFENRRRCPDIGEKRPACVYLQVKIFHSKCVVFFSCVFDEMFIEVRYFKETFPGEKFRIVCLDSGIIPFAKCSILSAWQCSEYASVSITA